MSLSEWTIVIDTSVTTGAVFLIENEQLVLSSLLEPRRQEELLAATLEGFLRLIKDRQGVLTRIILGEGPGSFTGLRISYAFVKGFVACRQVPTILVSSLVSLGIAANPQYQLPMTFAREARRDEYFIQVLSSEGISPTAIIEKNHPSGESTVTFVEDSLIETLPSEIVAKAFLSVATHHGQLVTWEEFAALEPQYGRPAAAKTSAERKGLR
jgi:tRNA threonylcarbamoyl adenosine modification protein YeaZ